jgi:hypothetical protein
MTASGEAMRDVPAHVRLERRYRRLLWAYPIGHRRAHGEEMLTMLMDSAEPGRSVPARADVLDLIRGAVRQWFRLPIGRTAVVAAVLTAVILGAVGAGVGSWLAWRTAAPLPSDTAALRTAEVVAGTAMTAPYVSRMAGRREPYPEAHVFDPPHERQLANWTLQQAQARLRADGWTLGAVREHILKVDGEPSERRVREFQATRGDHKLHAVGDTGASGTNVHVGIYPVTPAGEPGAIVVGWLAGAVTGWLLTGFVSYRLRGRTPARRLTALALGVIGVALAAETTTGLYESLVDLAFRDPAFDRFAPAFSWLASSPGTEQVGAALAVGVVILALATTGRRRPEAAPTPTPA